MGFKENLKAELAYRGMLVKELAAKSGVNKRTIDNYLDTHNYTPTADTAVAIAQVLGVSVEMLVIGREIRRDDSLSALPPDLRLIMKHLEELDDKLFGYVLNPLKNIAIGLVSFIPHLITIVIILWVAKYAIRLLKFFATQIEKERLVIPGFYPDWAAPTFNILRVLIYAFTVVVIYPYLPGSGSAVFQGVSVFIGVLFSLGSSSAIGNLIAGLVITYMRPFKVGDRIQFQNITGFVVEKSLTVIRIRTHKNEFVTFPNTMVLNSSIINYNTSADEKEEGLILHADVTMGYNVPWTQVHEILITAALKTSHVQTDPKPFVLQTALDDFYAKYQINAYTKDVDLVPGIYSELYQNLQDGFAAAGINLTAPAYWINMPVDARQQHATQ
ncbi:hypothetical protein FACS189493_1960 [Spirochaetia bacterium]|nr:hypothetical protein FACS189493_1960 [Spirochaetia bacterium]